MKKIVAILLLLTTFCIFSGQAYAVISKNDVLAPIEEYVEARYSCLASHEIAGADDGFFFDTPKTLHGKDFQETEKYMLTAEIALLRSASENLKYSSYQVYTTYAEPVISQNTASVLASIVCSFNYETSPNIASEFGVIYKFDLEQAYDGSWEIVGRSYPTIFDHAFWENNDFNVRYAKLRYSEVIDKVSNSVDKNGRIQDQPNVPEVGILSYNNYSIDARAAAADTALAYVRPDNTTWTSGTGYTYTYPSGYSQASLDCTNYVSFCLNYGGNIPEDSTGSYQWKRNTHAWYNVDGLYSYFSASKNDTEKGFYGTTYYSGSSYPSSTVRANTASSDIIQFSSVSSSDWTHSAIVTYKTSSNDVYVCMHDAQSYYSQCNLSYFYDAMYPSSGTRFIRFMKITGYYA